MPGRPAADRCGKSHATFLSIFDGDSDAGKGGWLMRFSKILKGSVLAVGALSAAILPASARVKNAVAEFSGIDKITGRIITFDVYIDETVQFGALQVTPRVCYGSAENEEPQTTTFVEVDEITLDRKIRRIFTGWMIAESPGLNAVEHAVYDVWLKSCKKDSAVPPPKS
jgi:hypothetical protein